MAVQTTSEGDQGTWLVFEGSFITTILCLQIVPGETALAFYSAKNPTNQTVTGIATYNVVPFDAGQYFNKIQVCCWCVHVLGGCVNYPCCL